jgi:hypothetical protein
VFTRANDQAARRALEQAGVDFIDADKSGPGVRLRVPPAETWPLTRGPAPKSAPPARSSAGARKISPAIRW